MKRVKGDQFRIRAATSADANGIAKVHVDSWKTTYRGIVPDKFLDSLSYMEHVERWQRTFAAQRTVVFVAESKLEGQIIGFASGGEERSKKYPEYPGELYAIYLLRGEQGKGLGTLLTTSVLGRLRQEGFNSVLVWVLAQNPYRHFYERMGGRFLGSQNIQIGEIALEEIAYGWRDTNALVERSKGPSSDS